jgi:drug/metabolite transporter (DMT)-like permease
MPPFCLLRGPLDSPFSRSQLNKSPLALPALVLGGIFIGGAPIFVRLSELGPTATAFHRMLWAVPLLWLWVRFGTRAGAVLPDDPRVTRRLCICGLVFALDLACWHLSIRYTSVTNATLFANFAPVVVTIGAWLFLHERITRGFLTGLALCISGAVLLVGSSFQASHRHVVGDFIGMITALFYGTYLLTVASLRSRVSTPILMFWSTFVAGIVLAGLALLMGEKLVPETMRGLTILIGLAIVTQAAGQGLIAYALGHLPASFSSLVILIQPVVAALLAWVLLGEPVTGLQAGGGMAIFAGILIARRPAN